MSTYRNINAICCIIMALMLVATVCFMNAGAFGIEIAERTLGYEDKIFDPSVVHTIDITMDDWDDFIENATSESYYSCDMVIDGEQYNNIAMRGKGNTSLTSVSNLDSERYSFKVEFDHYDSTKSYHGLDKLCLNNLIQDKTYMKDFITYQMMNKFGVASPLSSFAFISVNGQDWGLYLAVESVEDSFLQRNYGSQVGDLYKPDSQSFGGGKGMGKDFRMSEFVNDGEENTNDDAGDSKASEDMAAMSQQNQGHPGGMGGGPGGMGSDDVKLKYTDDDPESYSNIFDSAKTDVTDADKTRMIASLKALNDYEDLENVLDIDEVLRYFVVHNFVVNGDSYTGSMIHNYYLYESDGRLQMIPWDYNLAFGTFMGSDSSQAVNAPIDTPIIQGQGGMGRPMDSDSDTTANNTDSAGGNDDPNNAADPNDRPMLGWIFSSEEYTQMYHEYFNEFVDEILDSGYATSLIEKTAKLIAPYVERDATTFYSYEDFEKGYPALEEFIKLRTESVKGQLSGAIPSTYEGQQEDSAALTDASSLDINLLGTMNDTHQNENQGGMPTPPELLEPSPQDMENMPSFPGMENEQEASAVSAMDYAYAGGSAVLLLAGLIFAGAYKRRKGGL